MPLTNLNPEQLSAATASYGKNLIIASAGTGKTSTIVGRIAHLLNSGKKPSEILLLTFTNKAANEMVERIARAFGKEIAGEVVAGTFHSVSYKWLKKIGVPVVLKQPSELKMLFKTVYDRHMSNRARFDASPLTHQALYDYHSLWENRVDDDFGDWLAERNIAHKPYAQLYNELFEEFIALKEELGFASFNDLLLFMRKKLLAGVENPFFEVLVDEYQDTNPLQNSILEAINPTSLFCVGDYDQSIYAFNGAEISIIGTFSKRYKDARVFTLSKNYRSTAPILSLANQVISFNERIYPKKLEVVKDKQAKLPKLLVYGELFEQYKEIAKEIALSPYPRNEIAVIFRNNSSADGIEAMLRELGIASKRKGSGSFFDSKEIKVLLDLITLSINPKDLLSFIHILEYGKGIGAATAKDLFDASMQLGSNNIIRGWLHPDKSQKDIFKKGGEETLFGFVSNDKPQEFSHITGAFANHPLLRHSLLNDEGASYLEELHEVMRMLEHPKNPSDLIEQISRSKLYDSISNHLARSRSLNKNRTLDLARFESAKERIATKAETLKELAKHYKTVEQFINAMVLGSSEIVEGSGVNLLSVHASKGLEFEEVFVIDLADGRFPNRKLMKQGGEIEEERRLFYVAVTRAKESLILSYAEYDKYKKISYKPSQFLYEAGLITVG